MKIFQFHFNNKQHLFTIMRKTSTNNSSELYANSLYDTKR